MHRLMHLAMVCRRPHMAQVRSRQLLDGVLMSGTDDARHGRRRVSDGELRTADMSGVLWNAGLLSDQLLQ